MGGLTSSIRLLGSLIETHYRPLHRVALLMVQVKDVLHPSHELPTHFGNAPLFVLPWFEFVFFSIWRMASIEMLSANAIATTLSASSCSVQMVCPSGASPTRDVDEVRLLSAVQLIVSAPVAVCR